MRGKLALVGIGKIARDQHIPAIAANPDFTIQAVASRNASVDGVRSYPSLKALIEAEPEVDCVSLCTPPMARYGDAHQALDAGLHVMLEKPPGATLSEVHALQGLAAEQNATLFATWHSRHAAAVGAARDWLADKTLRKVEISWKENVRQWHPGQDWIWQAGGLGVFDPGINALSVMTAILPRAVFLKDAQLVFPENRDTPVAAQMTFHDPGGAEVTAELDWLEQGEPKWNIALTTDEGSALLSEGGARLTADGELSISGPDTEYPSLYRRFAELVKTGASDVDLSPMRHVADAFTMGQRQIAPPFEW